MEHFYATFPPSSPTSSFTQTPSASPTPPPFNTSTSVSSIPGGSPTATNFTNTPSLLSPGTHNESLFTKTVSTTQPHEPLIDHLTSLPLELLTHLLSFFNNAECQQVLPLCKTIYNLAVADIQHTIKTALAIPDGYKNDPIFENKNFIKALNRFGKKKLIAYIQLYFAIKQHYTPLWYAINNLINDPENPNHAAFHTFISDATTDGKMNLSHLDTLATGVLNCYFANQDTPDPRMQQAVKRIIENICNLHFDNKKETDGQLKDPLLQSKPDQTPLYYAFECENLEVVSLLLQYENILPDLAAIKDTIKAALCIPEACKNDPIFEDPNLIQALHFFCKQRLIQYIQLFFAVKIHYKPLWEAIKNLENDDIYTAFNTFISDRNRDDDRTMKPAHLKTLVTAILESYFKNQDTPDLRMQQAIKRSIEDICIVHFYKKKPKESQLDNELFVAAQNNLPSLVINYLLKNGDVNFKDRNGQTMLHWAAYKGHLDIVRLLLQDKNINVNLQDNFGRTALYWAVYKRRLDIVSLLLNDKNINVNLQNNEGRTALHWAVYKGRLDIVSLLLNDKNINVNLQDKKGKTALDSATQRGHLEIKKAIESLQQQREKASALKYRKRCLDDEDEEMLQLEKKPRQ